MSLGLGIHGEPGISETAVPTASELAELLVPGCSTEARGGRGRHPRGRDRQRPGHRQVRGAVPALRQHREAAPRRRARRGRTRMRRALHEPGHVRVLADPAVAGRGTRAVLGRPRRHPRVPARLGQPSGSASTSEPPSRAADDPAGERRVPAAAPARAWSRGGRGRSSSTRKSSAGWTPCRRRRPRDRHAARLPRGASGVPLGGRGGAGAGTTLAEPATPGPTRPGGRPA